MAQVPAKGIKVLVIDDDPALVEMVSIALKLGGFEEFSALSGEEGLMIASREVPDIIVLDVEMSPGMRGPQVLKALRGDPVTESIPVIFLTAKVDLDAMEQTVEEEAQAYILKPFSPYALIDRIEEVLEQG